MQIPSLHPLLLLLFGLALPALAADDVIRPGKLTVASPDKRSAPSLASLPPPAASGGLRILLVDDDVSDNNNIPGDSRLSVSDRVFRKLVSDAVGGDKAAWSIETVKTNASGPGIDRLRKFPLILWYTGASYGGNPDNTSVLGIEDEKTVRRYLEDTGGVVILVSPGYASKVLGAGSSWEESSWPFLSEVLGIRGGQGLAQRFEAGSVSAADGTRYNVGKNAAVETQFSLVNPEGAAVLFTMVPATAKRGTQAAPVATANAYGRGRILYVGFTFENLAEAELAPAFNSLLAATGLQAKPGRAVAAPAAAACPPTTATATAPAQNGGPATVQVSGTPTTAVVNWTTASATIQNARLPGAEPTVTRARTAQSPAPAAAQASTVKVERLVPNAASVQLNVASPDAQKADDPGPLAPGRAVTYRVTLMDGCTVLGSKEAVFTPPAARDPAGLTATVAADGAVTLTWQEVPGVTSYQITGTDLTAPVVVRRATEWRSPPAGAGPKQWKVASVYEPGGVLTAASAWPSVNTRSIPAAGKLFLTLPSGNGSTAETQAYSRTYCTDLLAELSACSVARFIRDATNWEQVWAEREEGASRRQWVTVPFADTLDLGVGRLVNCAPRKNGVTVCWASSHFPVASASGAGSEWVAPSQAAGAPAGAAPNFPFFARQAAEFRDARSLSLIVMSDTKAFFGSWKFSGPLSTTVPGHYEGGRWVTTTPPWGTLDAEHIYAMGAELQTAASLDTQGRKGVPHACLSCHGGTYNAATHQVTGASLLPLVPSRLVFANRTQSEDAVRRINQIVLQSNPAPGVIDQVQAMYNGAPNTPGAVANDAAVPAGWSQQPGLYRQVIAPYCASCHFAQRGPMNFRSWGNLLQNKDAVQRAVCAQFTMPHSEILYRRFWTEGGAVSLPGMLSTALGYPKCPQ